MNHPTSAQYANPDAFALDVEKLQHADAGVNPEALGATAAVATVIRHRSRIDEIDRQLIELIRERIAVSRKIQVTRLSTGGAPLSLSRETQIIDRYGKALGQLGTDAAMLLLRLSRGATNNEQREYNEIPICEA